MTLEEAGAKVREIERVKHDDEMAHSLEDELHEAVLQAIVDGHNFPRALALLALSTKNINFARHSS